MAEQGTPSRSNRRSVHETLQQRRATAATRRTPGQTRPGWRRTLLGYLASGRLVSAIMFLAALFGLGYCLTSPRFAVRQVELRGNRLVDPTELRQQLALEGQPIWYLDLQGIPARLTRSALIERASVHAELPDQVVIEITERNPEVRWQSAGVQYLVDAGGRVLGTAQEDDPNALLIVDPAERILEPNDQLDPDAVALAQQLALRLPGELGLVPATIGWDPVLGIYITTADGRQVIFGRTNDLERKLAVLQVLLTDGTTFSLLDLRPETPYYRTETVPQSAPASTTIP